MPDVEAQDRNKSKKTISLKALPLKLERQRSFPGQFLFSGQFKSTIESH